MYFITLDENGEILRHPINRIHMFSSGEVECRECGEDFPLDQLNLTYLRPFWLILCKRCQFDIKFHALTEIEQIKWLRDCIRASKRNIKIAEEYHVQGITPVFEEGE